jgi:uncharacterized membrane protein
MRRLRHRQPAQIALFAPIAIITFIGIIGVVVDIGIFRLIDSEFENAADAAALAAAWYDPVCPNSPPFSDPRCARTDNTPNSAITVATTLVSKNLGLASALCGSTPVVTVSPVKPLVAPSARAVSVIIHCTAPHVVGRILGVSQGADIYRWATAGLGDAVSGSGGSRSLGDFRLGDPTPLVVALVPL